MAVAKGLGPISFAAKANLASYQYHPVTPNTTSGLIQGASENGFVLGVLQNDPAAAGRECAIETKAGAVTKLVVSTTAAGSAISIGEALRAAGGTIGAVAVSTGGLTYYFARSLEAVSTGSADRIISAMLTHEGSSTA